MVIKAELLPNRDVPQGEDAHTDGVANGPHLHEAVRLAAMIDKATDGTLSTCIDIYVALQL